MSLLVVDSKGVLSASPQVLEAKGRSDLGFALRDKQEAAFVQSLTDPKSYLANRQKLKSDAETSALRVYQDTFNRVLANGYPEEAARSLAIQAGRATANVELGIVDLSYPNVYSGSALASESRKIFATDPDLSIGTSQIRAAAPRVRITTRRRRRTHKKSKKSK